MFRKKKEEGLDYARLNQGIRIGVDLLKIALILTIVLLVFISGKLLIDWGVLRFLRTLLRVLSPLFIGIVIAWLFDPVVTKLQKKGVNRVLGTLFVYVLLILFIYLLCRLMIPSIAGQLEDLGKSVPNIISYIQDTLDGIFKSLDKMGDLDISNIQEGVYESIDNLSKSLTVDLPTNIMNVASSIIAGGVNFFIGLLVGLYMLFDFDSVKAHIRSLVPKNQRKDVFELFSRLNGNLRNYVKGTLLIMGILFVFQSVTLGIVGLKAPMVFGLFCAVTDLIPYIGPYIGGIPAVLVGFSISPTTGIFALLAVVICQCLENYFLQPVVMGKTMTLHPVTIMVGLLVFNHFFGIIGMILATPTISILKTIFNFFNEKYKFMDKITFKEDKVEGE